MKTGTILIIIGVVFAILETVYFGNNLLPGSNAEFTCDCIAALFIVAGLYKSRSLDEVL